MSPSDPQPPASSPQPRDASRVTLVGAGLAGTLMAIFLARRGLPLEIFERSADLRREEVAAGRSINLALADRGLAALKAAGVAERVQPLLIPMRGRMLHDLDGTQTLVPYGQRPHEVIQSVSRPGLNRALLDHLEKEFKIAPNFGHACVEADFASNRLVLEAAGGQRLERELTRVIAADGAGSPVRRGLVTHTGARRTEELLPHGYKELTLPADASGGHQIDRNALHIWPRGGFMLIALPNVDGSFTVTLFLPHEGETSFAALDSPPAVERFFEREFPDARALMPALAEEFFAHPTGVMGTIRSSRWALEDRALLIGDAAHAIVPFHGQGMNCAFEDCVVLDQLLGSPGPLADTFRTFEEKRRPEANAIADMALENYVEMRDTVRDPRFQLGKELAFELERRLPNHFIPRYSMVMFHHEIPYSVAQRRGAIQAEIIERLTADAKSLEDINLAAAEAVVRERLKPLV